MSIAPFTVGGRLTYLQGLHITGHFFFLALLGKSLKLFVREPPQPRIAIVIEP